MCAFVCSIHILASVCITFYFLKVSLDNVVFEVRSHLEKKEEKLYISLCCTQHCSSKVGDMEVCRWQFV